jgi:hypothetical protein
MRTSSLASSVRASASERVERVERGEKSGRTGRRVDDGMTLETERFFSGDAGCRSCAALHGLDAMVGRGRGVVGGAVWWCGVVVRNQQAPSFVLMAYFAPPPQSVPIRIVDPAARVPSPDQPARRGSGTPKAVVGTYPPRAPSSSASREASPSSPSPVSYTDLSQRLCRNLLIHGYAPLPWTVASNKPRQLL